VEPREPETSGNSQVSDKVEEGESLVDFSLMRESSAPEQESLSPIQHSPSDDERRPVPRRPASQDSSAALSSALSSVVLTATASTEDLSLRDRSDRQIVQEEPDARDDVEESEFGVPPPPAPRSLPPPRGALSPLLTDADTEAAAFEEPEMNLFPQVLHQNSEETQENNGNEGSPSVPRGASPSPKLTNNPLVPVSRELETDLYSESQVDEKSLVPPPPPVNRSTRPPVPRPQTPTSPMSVRSNTKRSSFQSVPSRSASMEVPSSPASTRPTRRTTLPPPPPTVTHEPESLEEPQEEYMDEADTGTRP